VSGTTVLAGAPLHDDLGPSSGAAFVFELPPITTQTYCSGKTNTLGCIPFMCAEGRPSVSDTAPFSIVARDALPNEAGLLLYSFKRANLNFHGGKLCVKAPFTRLLPPKFAKTTGAPPCTGVLRRNFNNQIQGGNDPLLTAGVIVRSQWRQRDPGVSFGDTLSNGLQFAIEP